MTRTLQEAPVPERTTTISIYRTQREQLERIRVEEGNRQGRPVALTEVIAILIRTYQEAQK